MNTTTHTLVMHLIYIVLFLGDVREAINKVRRYVESESAFFNAFLEEGLRFSLSLYLCLIWIRILKHVFQKPNEAADQLINHPFFREFVTRPSTETYIDGLCESLQSVCIGSPVKLPSAKRRLSEILDQETSDEETASDTSAPPIKKSRVIWHSESEEDDLPSTSQIASSSKKNKRKQKKSESEEDALPITSQIASSSNKNERKHKKTKKPEDNICSIIVFFFS